MIRRLRQDLDTGEVTLQQVPVGAPGPGRAQVRVRCSVISSGTERALASFGRAGLVQKALSQPERVAQVLDRARSRGVMDTLEAVRARLAEPLAPGYACAGVVEAVGPWASSAGAPAIGSPATAGTPSWWRCPSSCAPRSPPGSASGPRRSRRWRRSRLQGVRLAAPQLGERFAVIGVGLIGQLACQLLRAHGCEVIAIDPRQDRRALAASLGAASSAAPGQAGPWEEALDGALVCAAAHDAAPLELGVRLCRRRGRVVLVGVAQIDLDRAPLYQREVTLQVSCSYGPGRYDRAYEERGLDYPPGYVRWTAQRNFEAALAQMARGALTPEALVEARWRFEQAPRGLRRRSPGIGTRRWRSCSNIRTGAPRAPARSPVLERRPARIVDGEVGVGVLGAGVFAQRTFLPALTQAGGRRRAIASAGGGAAAELADRFDFERAAAGAPALLEDEQVDLVCVLTRHDAHAELAARALEAGKHVWVEKPLARTLRGARAGPGGASRRARGPAHGGV